MTDDLIADAVAERDALRARLAALEARMPAPLTREAIAAMTAEEASRRMPEIDAALALVPDGPLTPAELADLQHVSAERAYRHLAQINDHIAKENRP